MARCGRLKGKGVKFFHSLPLSAASSPPPLPPSPPRPASSHPPSSLFSLLLPSEPSAKCFLHGYGGDPRPARQESRGRGDRGRGDRGLRTRSPPVTSRHTHRPSVSRRPSPPRGHVPHAESRGFGATPFLSRRFSRRLCGSTELVTCHRTSQKRFSFHGLSRLSCLCGVTETSEINTATPKDPDAEMREPRESCFCPSLRCARVTRTRTALVSQAVRPDTYLRAPESSRAVISGAPTTATEQSHRSGPSKRPGSWRPGA